MAKTFRFATRMHTDALFQNGRRTAVGAGVQLSGDVSSGTFSGRGFSGRYQLDGEDFVIEILKKPFGVPWWMIGRKLRGFFE